MSRPKHTPGPWTSAVYEVTPTFLDRLKHRQWGVCRDEKPGEPQGMLIAICGDIDPEEHENSLQSLADSYLIAAAPELLEALDHAHLQIIQLLNEGDFKRKIELDLGYIVDAIAKAQGRA